MQKLGVFSANCLKELLERDLIRGVFAITSVYFDVKQPRIFYFLLSFLLSL